MAKPRLCDYDGNYYCSQCHAGDLRIIPARVVYSWDFERRPVSKQAAAMLDFVREEPVFNLRATCPTLYGYIDELRDACNLRERLIRARQWLEAENPSAM